MLAHSEATSCHEEESETLARLRVGMLNIAVKLGQGVDRRGNPSRWIIDCRELLLTGPYLRYAARLVWERIKKYEPDFVGGMTLAANPLTLGVMYESRLDNQPVDGFLIRREQKAYGLRKRVEGPPMPAGSRVVLLDDLVSSGGTQTDAIAALKPFAVEVVAVGVIVNFEKAGAQLLAKNGIPLEALYTLADLGLSAPQPGEPRTLNLEWKAGPLNHERGKFPMSGPCVSGKHIFVGSNDNFFLSLALDGTERWRHQPREHWKGIHSSPLVHNKKVYFGAYDGFLYCLDADEGKLIWESRIGQWIGSSPAFVPATNSIVIGVEYAESGGQLVAVDADSGTTQWIFQVSDHVPGSPMFDAARDQIIFGSNDFTLYAVDTGGRERWRFLTGGAIKCRPTVDEAGTCFVGSFDGHLYAVDGATGAERWKRRAGQTIDFTALVQGDLVITASGARLIACNRDDGQVRWIASAGGSITGGATAVGDSHLAFGAEDGMVYLLEAATGRCVDSHRTGNEIASTPAFCENLLLIPSRDTFLHALTVSFMGPAPVAASGENAAAPQELKYFRRIKSGLDIQAFLDEVGARESLWDANQIRQKMSPEQRETQSISLRHADRRDPRQETRDVYETKESPLAAEFPRIMRFLNEFAAEQNATVARAMLVRLRPHGRVYPHDDQGLYYKRHDRYHLVLSSGGSWLSCGGEVVIMQAGELWWFENKVVHESRNDSEIGRVHVIFDLLRGSGPNG